MTKEELRAAVVAKGLSREKKNQYTRGEKRTQVGSGWSDCSSFVRWCYLQVCGVDIGGNTAAQIENRALTVVDSAGGRYPDEALLLPGDLLYYKGTDKSRPYQVGHVEMYIGNGTLLGHGSGIGPTRKNLKSYSASRYGSGRGYIRTLRVIPSGADEEPVPADPMQSPPAQMGDIRITGAQVNLRTGPGTEYEVARIARAGEVFAPVNADGWRAILASGKVLWVSASLSEEV